MIKTNASLILASSSQSRQALLASAGLNFKAISSALDEHPFKRHFDGDGKTLASTLAQAKAFEISQRFPQAYVIACDQVCQLDNTLLSKPQTKHQAKRQLQRLAGRSHQLHSALCIQVNGKTKFAHCETCVLEMRALTTAEIEAYVQLDEPLYSCGSYYYEKHGKHLFSKVYGSEDAILGLSIVPLLNFFYQQGLISIALP